MKSVKKNILLSSLFVIAVFILGIFLIKGINKSFAATTDLPNNLKAKSPFDINNLEESAKYYRNPGEGTSEDLQTSIKYLSDGTTDYVAYCLNKDKGWPTTDQNITFTKSSEPMDVGYSYIMINGYPNKRFTSDPLDDNYITQLAVWLYENEFVDSNVLTAAEVNDIKNYKYYNSYVKPLIEGARNARTTGIEPNPSFSVNQGSFTYNTTEDYYISNTISVTSNTKFENYKVALEDVNSYEILDANENIIIKKNKGTMVKDDSINYGEGFKIRIPSTAIIKSTNITINLSVNYTQYDTYKYTPPQGEDYQNAGVSTLVPVSKTKTVSSTFTLPKGSLKIEKVDIEGRGIIGAKFLVEGPNGYSEEVDMTDVTETTLTDLIPGTYTITEIIAPSGYITSDPVNVTVSLNNTTEAPIINDEVGWSINKIDSENGRKLAGAVIEVYEKNSNPKKVALRFTTTGTSENDYEINNGLEYGKTYIAYEVEAPEGYILDSTEHEFTIDRNNSKVELNIPNTKNSTNIIKLDQESKCFANAGLALYKNDGTFIERWTSSCNGTTAVPHTVKGLAKGRYYVVEESVPAGYIKSTTKEYFDIDENQTITKTVTFTNTKKNITLKKVDEDGVPIAGAKLRVYNNNTGANAFDRTYTTETTPISLDNLPNGTYYVEEIQAPNGFIKSNEIKSFTITDTTTNESIPFENKRNKIKAAKVDKDGNYLRGAKLKVVDSNNNVIDSWTTTASVHTISTQNLVHGTYYLVEEEAPEGYIRDKNVRVPIVLSETSNNETVYTITNTKMDISILKVDENNDPLPGVTLEIIDSNNQRVVSWVTTETPYKLTNITYGNFKIREVKTIDGYILDKTEYPLVIDENTTTISKKIENKPIKAEFAKIDSKTGDLIAGAELKLSRVDGSMTPIVWTTTNEVKTISKLPKGKYILEETKAPEGYVNVGNKVEFEIEETGKLQKVYMKDNYITASVSNKKIKISTNNTAGFKFKLVNENKEEVDEWTMTNEDYTTDALPIGKYLLYEEEVPEGYILQAEPYEILVTNSETVEQIRIVNNPINVSVSKKDFTTGEEIEGAELVLKDYAGNTIDTWVSTKEEHKISKLPKGKYKLIETIAPEGYVLSKEEVEFEVKETGEIQTAVMYNTPKVEVPNTAASANKVLYIVAAILLVSGFGLTSMVLTKKN